MEKSSSDKFKQEFSKEFSKLGSGGSSEGIKYLSSFKENEDEMEKPRKNPKSTHAKTQFAKDILNDPDYVEFKKNAMRVDDNKSQYSFGTPRADKNDPFIKKKKYKHVGKEEATEATGTASSGPVVGKVAFMDSDFVRSSFKETPKLQKEDVEKVEAKEAATSGNVGGYQTPAMWAKSTKKKDWGPSRKTQYPGGSFVKVKEKCTKFPYCNQGDINALKLSKNESVKEAIREVSKQMGLSEDVIITILEHEYQILNKRTK